MTPGYPTYNRAVTRTRTKLMNGPDTPAWWPIIQIALGIGFVGYLLFSLAGDGGQAELPAAEGPPPVVAAPTDDPTDTSSDDPTDDPGTETPSDAPTGAPGGDTVAVEAADGSGHLDVDVAARATAKAAAEAMFTGNFSRVPFVPGTSAPSTGATWPDPRVGQATVRDLGGDLLQFVFTVDPDGDGGESARRTTVHVRQVSGTWAFRGD